MFIITGILSPLCSVREEGTDYQGPCTKKGLFLGQFRAMLILLTQGGYQEFAKVDYVVFEHPLPSI